MCRRNGTQLFVRTAHDTFQGHPLTSWRQEKNKGSIVKKMTRELCYQFSKGNESHAVETDLDIANGTRREITKIVLDERETAFSST